MDSKLIRGDERTPLLRKIDKNDKTGLPEWTYQGLPRKKSPFKEPLILPIVDVPTVDNVSEIDEHLIPLEALEQRFGTSRTMGLTEQQASTRRMEDGPNVLSPPKTTPVWLQFLKCLIGGFGVVLWTAFILCILAYEPLGNPPDIYNIILALVLLTVIIIQALFFFFQERKSSNLMASFATLLPPFCHVLRGGQMKNVEAKDLVVGDVVFIKAGDKVPADLRLFEVNQAKVEKSSLTGESEPIPLSVTQVDPNVYETRNLALFGTSILEGTAAGIVINTADRTIMGKVARVASTTSSVSTSLQKELNYFAGLITLMAAMLCVITVGGYYAVVAPYHPGYLSVSLLVTNCIAAVVALVPDGAPVALAMFLTLIAKRVYAAKILVKKLTVLETLGCATLIASDKTGTLTRNRMTLSHLWIVNDYKGGQWKTGEEASETIDDLEKDTGSGCFGAAHVGKNLSEPALNFLCQAMCLCNKTVFEGETADGGAQVARTFGHRNIVGNPTEGALLNGAESHLDTSALRRSTPIVGEIAFSSRTKYHLTLHKIGDRRSFQNTGYAIRGSADGEAYDFVIFAKGAPEYVLSMCSKSVVNGDETLMNPDLKNRVLEANEQMAGYGQRVLAFAYKKLYASEYPDDYQFNMEDENRWTSDLCFLGLAGIIDPPRDGVAESIIECHNAHVRVMMVTGDQPTTAVAIARAVNIVTHKEVKTITDVVSTVPFSHESEFLVEENKWMSKLSSWLKSPPERTFRDESIVIAGTDIGQLNRKQWDFVLEHREVVFARTTPQQKLQIVKEARSRGDVVAVTGDGVNDAPALKAADLGVAMGICGSDVSKEAANMILLDDNFVTIVKGIKEGRLLFDNLKKVICYLFPSGSFSEILPVLATTFLGMPMPLSSFLMIVICVGTDMVGSLGMIHEHPESDLMHRPPRNVKRDRLVTGRTILFAYFFIGVMESSIAFFMYFLTMWMGGVHPNKLLFAYTNWGTKDWIPDLTPDQQIQLNYKGQSAFFVALVMCQLWNILAVRTRYHSVFTQKFQKKLLKFMLAEVFIVLLTVYLPVVQQYMHTVPMEYYHFLIPLAMGSIILMMDEIRKLLVRTFPDGPIAKLAW